MTAVSYVASQKKLAGTWIGLSFILGLFILMQKLSAQDSEAVWKWYFTSVGPLMTLCTGVFARILWHSDEGPTVSATSYRITMALVVFYFVVLFVTAGSLLDPTEEIARASTFLLVIHGVVAAMFGVFFGTPPIKNQDSPPQKPI